MTMRLATLLLAVAVTVAACGGKIAADADGGSGAGATGDAGTDGGCATGHCVDAALACPASPPKGGSSCANDGQICDPWSAGCGTQCTCKAKAWHCVDTCTQCPPPPRDGASCTGQVGLTCKYDVGCASFMDCLCNDSMDGSRWACSDACDAGR